MSTDPITTVNFSLPESMRQFVRRRMEKGGFANTSEYMRHLIREDQKAEMGTRLEDLLREGAASGPPIEVNEGFWKAHDERVRKRVAELRRSTKRAAG